MMEFSQFMDDRYTYPLMPQEHRWIYNKLTVAEVFGYDCGPAGTPIKKPGFYCQRPMMSCAGYGAGGFLKFHAKQTQAGITQPELKPGYFWSEWFEGWHGWTDFTDDEPFYECGGRYNNGEIILQHRPPISFTELPEQLRGISKHMLVEHLGGKIIEVSPRNQEMVHNSLDKLLSGLHYIPTKMVLEPYEGFGHQWRLCKRK